MRIQAWTILIAICLLGAATVTACSGPSRSREFKTILHRSQDARDLPVVLRDETGMVTGIESGPTNQTFDYSAPAARADPTDPSAFIVSWLGGACDNDALLRFSRNSAGYVIGVEVHGKLGFPGGCPAVGIPRDVRIVTSSPIPLDSIVAAGST